MEKPIELKDFVDFCVKEFCNHTGKPAVTYKGIDHYLAQTVVVSALKTLKHIESQKHVIDKASWAFPNVFKNLTSYAIIEQKHAWLLIKFGEEMYWRCIPPTDAPGLIAQAKRLNLYQKTKDFSPPKQVPVKKQSVESFIERCYFECLNPNPQWETYKGSMLTKEGENVMLTNIWHPSVKAGIDLITELHAANIDVVPYYQSFPHMNFAKKHDWCCIEDDQVGLCIEARVGRLCYQKIVPDFLKPQMRSYSRANVRLFESPRFLFNEKSTENVWFLKP